MKMFFILLIASGVTLAALGQNIVQAEYFLDADAGVAKNTLVNLAPSSDGSFSFTANVSGITPGNHLLYIRTKDETGIWSLTTRKYIEILPQQTQSVVARGEYFFDVDPGFERAMPVIILPQDSVVMQNFIAAVSGLSPGYHKMYVRFIDSYGKWSHASRSTVSIQPVETQNNLIRGEYFFDHEPGYGTASPFTVSPKDSAIRQSFMASVAGLLPGPHLLYERLTDSSGNWSQTVRRTVEVVNNPDTDYIVTVEYFFKNDPGFANAAPARFSVPARDGTFQFSVPSKDIPVGLDTLFIRVKDSSSFNWSITKWKVVSSSGSLPLTLLNFQAIRQNQAVFLNWQTENEVNTAYFNVQRSTDGIHFITVGKVTAKGYIIFRSSYEYTDTIVGIQERKLYYRLQEMDSDGKPTYSSVKLVNLETGSMQFTIAPNPASGYVNVLSGSSINSANATIVITDLAGHILVRERMTGTGSQRIDLSSFAKGMYSISIITPQSTQTQKLVVR